MNHFDKIRDRLIGIANANDSTGELGDQLATEFANLRIPPALPLDDMQVPDSPAGLPDRPARHNCAFCGWERTPADDHHAPACDYWHFSGDQDAPCPCWRCNDLPDPRTG